MLPCRFLLKTLHHKLTWRVALVAACICRRWGWPALREEICPFSGHACCQGTYLFVSCAYRHLCAGVLESVTCCLCGAWESCIWPSALRLSLSAIATAL